MPSPLANKGREECGTIRSLEPADHSNTTVEKLLTFNTFHHSIQLINLFSCSAILPNFYQYSLGLPKSSKNHILYFLLAHVDQTEVKNIFCQWRWWWLSKIIFIFFYSWFKNMVGRQFAYRKAY